MGKTFDCFVYRVYIIVVTLPVTFRNRQCHVLYSNIRGLYGNLHDLIVASKGFYILFCSETLVSNFRTGNSRFQKANII